MMLTGLSGFGAALGFVLAEAPEAPVFAPPLGAGVFFFGGDGFGFFAADLGEPGLGAVFLGGGAFFTGFLEPETAVFEAPFGAADFFLTALFSMKYSPFLSLGPISKSGISNK
jgi:hypothetical protein